MRSNVHGVESPRHRGQEQQRMAHERAMKRVMDAAERGECEPETAYEAMLVLTDWYDATGTSIDRAIPAYLRVRKRKDDHA
jgi:hypothetical protein